MKKYLYIVFLILTFLVIDIFLRFITINNSYLIYGLLFDLSFISLLIGIILLVGKLYKKIIYTFFSALFSLLFITNILYYKFFYAMFSTDKIKLAGEGKSYVLEILNAIPLLAYICIFIVIGLGVLFYKTARDKNGSFDKKLSLSFIMIFVFLRVIALFSLGSYENDYKALDSLKNAYVDHIDSNKAFSISGFYEYTFRDVYLSYIRKPKYNEEELISNIDYYLSNKEHSDNLYTDIFKDKNLIFVMMESIDTYLINETDMPTLYYMKNNSIDFTKHYSPRLGGGDTFNTEFTINTGLIPPSGEHITFRYPDYVYPYSLGYMFRESGYTAESFHFNTSTFYNRDTNHKKFGYTKYNSLVEMGFKETEYGKDSIFFDDIMYGYTVKDTKFLSFIITYSAHMPYSTNNYLCSEVLDGDPSEIECLRAQAKETDNMLKLLLERLEEDGLLEDTVIVLTTDHFVYGLYDKSEINALKGTEDSNLLTNTPFIIFNNGLKDEVTYLSSSVDVVPTLVNMFGLGDTYSNYMGNDVFSIKDENVVYFKDYSFLYKDNYFKNNSLEYGDLDINKIDSLKKSVYDFYEINDSIFTVNYFNK